MKYSQYSVETLARMGLTLQVIKTTVASGISWGVASLLSENPYPIFAPLAAILTMQVTVSDSIQRGLYRTLGVIFGVSIGGLIGHFFVISSISVLIAILLGLSLSTAFRLNQQIISQVGVSALLVLGYGQMEGYMIGRIGETIVGAITAVVVNVSINPPDSSAAIKEMILQSTKRLAEVLQELEANSAEYNLSDGLLRARQLVQQTEKDCESLIVTLHAFRYTPFRRKERLMMERLVLVMNRIEHMTIQVRGIARSLFDLKASKQYCFDFSGVLQSTAQCIEIFGQLSVDYSPELENRLIRLMKEARNSQVSHFLHFQQLAQSNFVPEIGGVFTDLERIFDEIENRFPMFITVDTDGKRLARRAEHNDIIDE